MKPNFYIALAIYLSALAIRNGYEILKETGRVNPKNQALFLVILVVMILLWLSWFFMCPVDPLALDLPAAIQYLGLAVVVIGLILAVGALIQLRGVENIEHLVTTGLFARLRHPMYLGFVFWILGWAIYNGAAISLMAGLVGIGCIIYWRSLEEVHLEKMHGEKYVAYRQQTWF
jgi:protein-S-isoprenylcysteine O-methyltransferase Ste14